MSYKTILVHLELGHANEGLLKIAANLGQLFDAHIIGIAACQPIQLLYDQTYATIDILGEDRKQIEEQLQALETRFRTDLGGKVRSLEWRSTVTPGPLADYIADEARCADLLVTGPEIAFSVFDHTRQVRIADLVFGAGRPVLIVPRAYLQIDLDRIIVGWKETAECRRAVAEALPLLKLAKQVTILEMAPPPDVACTDARLGDVAKWLDRHGVKANTEVVVAQGSDVAYFARLVRERSAGLVVAGAYGHSRVREWALGGLTGDYLIRPHRPVLLAH